MPINLIQFSLNVSEWSTNTNLLINIYVDNSVLEIQELVLGEQ